MEYVIGIDSGGTHIVGQALSLTGEIILQTQCGPGNIFLDEPSTIKNLKAILTSLFAELDPGDCQYILMGIAGVETTGNASQVAKDFTTAFSVKTYVISDAQLALLNGLEGHDGTLVIAGTGSVVYGRQQRQLIRYGGWGNLLGDTGSAYKITEQAMLTVLKQHDLQRTSSLTPIMLQALEAKDIKQAVRHYYQLDRKGVAAISLKIAQASERGDQEATDALQQQAKALAAEILGLFDRYEQPIPKQIAFSGSVLVHNVFYRQTVLQQLRRVYPDLEPIVVSTNNGRGAIFWRRWQAK